jgi:hypothetical protein
MGEAGLGERKGTKDFRAGCCLAVWSRCISEGTSYEIHFSPQATTVKRHPESTPWRHPFLCCCEASREGKRESGLRVLGANLTLFSPTSFPRRRWASEEARCVALGHGLSQLLRTRSCAREKIIEEVPTNGTFWTTGIDRLARSKPSNRRSTARDGRHGCSRHCHLETKNLLRRR